MPRLPDRPLRLRVPAQLLNWREIGLLLALSLLIPSIWFFDPNWIRDFTLRNAWEAAAPGTARVTEVRCARGCSLSIEHSVAGERRTTKEFFYYMRQGSRPSERFDVLRARDNPEIVTTRITQEMLLDRTIMSIVLIGGLGTFLVFFARMLWRERQVQQFSRLNGVRLQPITVKLFGHRSLGLGGTIWYYGSSDSSVPTNQLRLPFLWKPFELDGPGFGLGVTDGDGPPLLVDDRIKILKLRGHERAHLFGATSTGLSAGNMAATEAG